MTDSIEPRGPRTSIDAGEIANFTRLAADWWNPNGPLRNLHGANPFRLEYVVSQIAAHEGFDPKRPNPLNGLRILDVGCGGGLLAEGLARLGASVVGIDPVPENIGVAQHHAAESGLAIDYRAMSVEALAAAGELFDIVISLEVVEHVSDVDLFIDACGKTVKPNGLMIVSTENRTLLSFLILIVVGEYLLRWIPIGTHRYDRLVTPQELKDAFRRAGLNVQVVQGVKYVPFVRRLSLTKLRWVSYVMMAAKPRA